MRVRLIFPIQLERETVAELVPVLCDNGIVVNDQSFDEAANALSFECPQLPHDDSLVWSTLTTIFSGTGIAVELPELPGFQFTIA